MDINQPSFPPQTNPFTPESLSPLPGPERSCGLPYELTWSDLWPALPGFIERSEHPAQAFEAYTKQGLNGGPNSCILTLRYPGIDSTFRTETIFLKRIPAPEKNEACKYQYLGEQGFPVPRLLAVVKKGDVEIIVLEFLPVIGIDFRSTHQIRELLCLVAKLNAIQNPPEFFNPLPGLPQAEFNAQVRDVLTKMTREYELPFSLDVSHWLEIYQKIENSVRAFPLALNHGQFFFQQVGWAQRENFSQLVLFDLETMCLMPCFTDIAGILKSLAGYSGRDELDLFKIYFDHLCELTGPGINMQQTLQELKQIRILDTFCSLPWLYSATAAGMTDMLHTAPALAIIGLHEDLTALGLL